MIAGLVALVIACLLAVVYNGELQDARLLSSQPSTAGGSTKGRPSTGLTLPTSRSRPATTNPPSLLYEIRNTTDVRATYEKYKSMNDPTGAVAYALVQVVGGCVGFADPKWVDQLRTAGAQPKTIDNPRRDALIERLVTRCKGFSGWDQKLIFDAASAMLKQAQDARYPPAIARYLSVFFSTGTIQQSDATAKELLAGDLDGDVVKGVYDYLARRNGGQLPKQQGDPDVMSAAWELLACNYGADCGQNNDLVVGMCLSHRVCEDDLESALPRKFPSLTPERMAEAARNASVIADQIRNRDWGRLGF